MAKVQLTVDNLALLTQLSPVPSLKDYTITHNILSSRWWPFCLVDGLRLEVKYQKQGFTSILYNTQEEQLQQQSSLQSLIEISQHFSQTYTCKGSQTMKTSIKE